MLFTHMLFTCLHISTLVENDENDENVENDENDMNYEGRYIRYIASEIGEGYERIVRQRVWYRYVGATLLLATALIWSACATQAAVGRNGFAYYVGK